MRGQDSEKKKKKKQEQPRKKTGLEQVEDKRENRNGLPIRSESDVD